MLTPPGRAALATLRLEGTGVGAFLARRFSRPVEPMRCVHGLLRDDDGVIDDPVVVLHPGGRCADITLHAGQAVIDAATQLAQAEGFESASRSDADAASLIEAEVLDALPDAPGEIAIELLLRQPNAWRAMIRAHPTPDQLRAMLHAPALATLLSRPSVALIGLPNAGKSTLANALAGRDRSIVSDVPGTTRDWVGSIVELQGVTITLIDTPGRRETPDPIERRAIEISQGVVREARAVVIVADGTQPSDAINSLRASHPDALVVRSKSDLQPHASWLSEQATALSAQTGEGLDQLRREIRVRLGVENFDRSRAYAWVAAQRERIESVIAGRANAASLDPPARDRRRFPKSSRLHRQSDFRRVQSRGRRHTSGPLTIFVMPSERSRLGVRTPRAVGSAPRRNKIKRLLREAFRTSDVLTMASVDLLVIVRAHEPMSLADYRAALLGALANQPR
jgi:ribonuclease P protein component